MSYLGIAHEVENLSQEVVNLIQGELIPVGGIIMWSGSTDNIPAGWTLCDGTNGAPDLQDRMIVGAGNDYGVGDTGGSDTQTSSTDGSHSHSGSTSTDGNHSHTGSTSSDGSHDHGGTNNRTLSTSQMPSHDHDLNSATSHNTGTSTSQFRTGDTEDNANTYYTNSNAMYDTGGSNSHSHSISNDGYHNHSLDINSNGSHDHSLNINSNGDHSHSVDVRSRYYALAYIMKV